MSSKETQLMDYFKFPCLICSHKDHYVQHKRPSGWCFVCKSCHKFENVRECLARIYKQPLARCKPDYRKKLLDMMARDVVRKFHQISGTGQRARDVNKQFDLLAEDNTFLGGPRYDK